MTVRECIQELYQDGKSNDLYTAKTHPFIRIESTSSCDWKWEDKNIGIYRCHEHAMIMWKREGGRVVSVKECLERLKE